METELTSPAAARVEAPSALVGEREHAVSWRQPRAIVPYHSNRTHALVSLMDGRKWAPGTGILRVIGIDTGAGAYKDFKPVAVAHVAVGNTSNQRRRTSRDRAGAAATL